MKNTYEAPKAKILALNIDESIMGVGGGTISVPEEN